MQRLMTIFALLLFVVIGLYLRNTVEGHNPYGPGTGPEGMEGFANPQPTTVEPVSDGQDIASVNAGPLLADVLSVKAGLTSAGSESCASLDRARQMELGGQYVQRTNNYRRDYPDNCSAPRSDFVGSVYSPADGVGLTVPCSH